MVQDFNMTHTLPSPKSTRKSKRLGRGMGTGVGGHTVGRGLKGATARTGHKDPRPNFEGGQNPLARRLPKYRGFSRGFIKSKIHNAVVKLSDLAEFVKETKNPDVTMQTLIEAQLIKPKYNKSVAVKILFDKEIDQKINIKEIKTSKAVKSAVEKAGGSVA